MNPALPRGPPQVGRKCGRVGLARHLDGARATEPEAESRYLVFSKVGPNQSIERGQVRISKSADPSVSSARLTWFSASLILPALLPLANETKRLYSFVRKPLTKRWFCDDDANQTEQPPRDLCPQDLQGRVFPGLCAPATAPGSTAGPPAALGSA